MQDVLNAEQLFSRPAALLPATGYGLPQYEERETLLREGRRYAAQRHATNDRLQRQARQWLSPQQRGALETTEANLDILSQRLRELHRQQGGLLLDALGVASGA